MLLRCESCGVAVRVVGDFLQMEKLILKHPLWKTGWPCITFGCSGQLRETETAELVTELTPEQLFRALCGGGTPEEIKAYPALVRALLRDAKVVEIDADELVGDGRAVIRRLFLDSGFVLHLSGMPTGAFVYKITHPDKRTIDGYTNNMAVQKGA